MNSLSPAINNFGLWLLSQIKRNPGTAGSLSIHMTIILALIIGMPSFLKKELPVIHIISAELLPVKDITNVKPKESKPKAKPKKKYRTIKVSPVKKITSKPKFVTKKKVAEKPKVKPKPKPKPKAKDFDSVLKSIADSETEKTRKKTLSEYNPSIPLSISEISEIIYQVSKCWSIPAGARDAENIAVKLRLSLERDGSVKSAKIVDQYRYRNPSETFYRAAADSAIRAVHACSPIKNLPQKKYDSWSELELRFDPKELLF